MVYWSNWNWNRRLAKRVAQKTAEAAGDWIRNKIADKITAVGKTKSKEKEHETNKRQEIYIPAEKDNK